MNVEKILTNGELKYIKQKQWDSSSQFRTAY